LREVGFMVYCQNCGKEAFGVICDNCGQIIQIPLALKKQLPVSTKTQSMYSSGKLKLIIIIIVAAILILSGLLFLFFISKESDRGPTEGLTVEMTATDCMKVDIKGEYAENNSSSLRDYIDEYHGDGNNNVTSQEVRDFEEDFEDNWGELSYGYTIDWQNGVYSLCSLKLTDAQGQVTSEKKISFSLSATIDWPDLNIQKDSYIIEISLFGMEISQFWFKSPPGYEIYRIGGLVEEINPGKKTAVGTIDDDAASIHITILKSGTSVEYESGDREPNDSMQTAGSISDGDLITGTLNAQNDEEDYYYINLRDADDIEINLTGSGFTDFDLRLYNPDGYQVEHSANEGSDEYIRHESFSTGYHYIKVNTYSGSGEYLLKVEIY
jgi:hypothetical protein